MMKNIKELLLAKQRAAQEAQKQAHTQEDKIAPKEPEPQSSMVSNPVSNIVSNIGSTPAAPKLSLKERIEARKLLEQQAKENKALAAEAAEEAPEAVLAGESAESMVKEHSVFAVDGVQYTYEELQKKVAASQGLKKLKVPATLARIARLEEALQEADEIIGQYLESKSKARQSPAETAPSEAQKSVIQQAVEALPAEVKTESFALNITLNERQLMARDMAMEGKSFCLIGAAGTGKTTCQRAVAQALLDSGKLLTTSYKLEGKTRIEAPSFAAVAFTRRASANLARAINKDPGLRKAFPHNVMTIHALLEYEPVYYHDDVMDKDTMRFAPMRHARDPLDVTHLVIEESSMIGLDLWEKLYDALKPGVQIIFIGDINQLPPVFGPSILNYALVQLPVIELTEVYRQAGDSGILENAHRVLKGESIIACKDVHVIQGKDPKAVVGQERSARALTMMFEQWYKDGIYDPEQDIILSPFNKQPLGTDNMNSSIAQFVGKARDAVVYEVLAGFNKHYLAVGDKVMFNKQDGYITRIVNNGQYFGAAPLPASTELTRFGFYMGAEAAVDLDEEGTLNYENFSLEELASEKAERKQQASHVVYVQLENGSTETLQSAGDFGPAVFSLGYCLTVHKAQGCEFRKVFGLLHKAHSVMLFRELLYTLMTRAREELYLIAKQFLLDKAVSQPRIKGDSIEEKIAYFNSGAAGLVGEVSCTKT